MTRLLIALIALSLAGCAASDQDVLAGPDAVQHLSEGRPVDIPPAVAELRAVAPYSTRYDLVLPGRRAAFRTGGPEPAFFSIYPGSEIKLYRLERGTSHDDRNLKVRVVSGIGWEIPSDVVVALDASREGDGLYRLTPRGGLPPGEYAFLTDVDAERWKRKYTVKAKLFSFGVD